ncbi:unannotated protein [freshwater metagenome]|uniref:Unannotated protein n=1 Tax=freshwater metagenome TaxID=449393 RepID=A0A6J7HZW4_9ZZZZ|nr:hypothetical protein [Actinomycetota bacterium]MSW35626.1 hypothetical protein [Actinomycetota bacterium]
MIASLRYEWVRISTVRSTKIFLVLALVLSAGLAYLIASPQHASFDDQGSPVGPETVNWFGAFGFPLTLVAVLASVVASQAIGQEYRFGLIRLTLTAFPRRLRTLSAKLIVVVLAGLAFALVSFLGSEIGVSLRGHPVPPEGVAAPDSSYLVRGAVFVVLWGLSAFAIAGVTRQTAVGIAVPIISGLIVENLLLFVLTNRADWLVKILPWSTAARWMSPDDSSDPLGRAVAWPALGVFGVWVLVFLVAQVVTFQRRDA